MNFNNPRFITKGVSENVSFELQMFMWNCIDTMQSPKDYFQVFKCTENSGKQKITHIQEEPDYKKEYLINSDTPFYVGKIFVIDDESHSTMLLAEEY